MNYREHAKQIFHSALQAVEPGVLIKDNMQATKTGIQIADQFIPISDIGRIIIIAAGKAAASMSLAAEMQLGNQISHGICITKYGHALPLQRIELIESGHPVPDSQSMLATSLATKHISNLQPADIVILLLSGGASSLMSDLPEGCTLQEVQLTNSVLVNSGANISEINIVRKHLSHIKGGQFARMAQPAKVFTLIISDVPGDDLSSIASGPVTADPSTFHDALNIVKKYKLTDQVPLAIREYLQQGAFGLIPETPKPGDPVFRNVFSRIIGNNHSALMAARAKAKKLGYTTEIAEEQLTGTTELTARAVVRRLMNYNGPSPHCFIWGGETTIMVAAEGSGGRNQHFALCALDEMLTEFKSGSTKNITMLCAGTDGTDGPTDATGAIADTLLIQSGYANKKKIHSHLSHFNAYPFFKDAGTLLVTGPTQTNVMDLVIALIHDNKNPDLKD